MGMFCFFNMFNALGYVCGGPLPIQVLLTRWFDKSRGKALGFAYLGIGLGGAMVPWISHELVQHFDWHAAPRTLGSMIIVTALPATIVPLVAAEIFGIQGLGLLLGVVLTANGVAEAGAPWLVGHLRDATGSYAAGLALLIAMGLLGVLAAASLPKGQKRV